MLGGCSRGSCCYQEKRRAVLQRRLGLQCPSASSSVPVGARSTEPAQGVCACIVPTPAASFPLPAAGAVTGEQRQLLLRGFWYRREALQVFPYLSFPPCLSWRDAQNASSRSPSLSCSPGEAGGCQQTSRVVPECCSGQGAGILLFSCCGGFICISHRCLGRLSRCFCNQPHISKGWGRSKSWEYFHLPA